MGLGDFLQIFSHTNHYTSNSNLDPFLPPSSSPGTMIFPQHVYDQGFRKEYLNSVLMSPAMRLTIQCFGSQGKSFIPCAFCHSNLYLLAFFSLSATLCGLTILSTKWDSTSYRNFGMLMIPYFVFDAYFYSVGALTTLGAVGDGGNTTIPHCGPHTLCCLYTYLSTLLISTRAAIASSPYTTNTLSSSSSSSSSSIQWEMLSLRSVVISDIRIAKKKKKRKGYNYKGGSLFRFIQPSAFKC